MVDNFESTFVIECCENCRSHQWNTRHDPGKYDEFFNNSKFSASLKVVCTVASAITSKVPDATVLKNSIPKAWVDFEIYCQLLPDDNTNNPHFAQIPRIGAFEISFKGIVRTLTFPNSSLAHIFKVAVRNMAAL